MRQVKKGKEPRSLTEYRLCEGARYDGDASFGPVKQEIREALCRDQGGLCAYCSRRIRPDADSMNIEHWQPQDGSYLDLSWSNMLACCRGRSVDGTHCDHRKGHVRIELDPQKFSHMCTVFEAAGRICSTDTDLDHEINFVLALNLPSLVRGRQAAIEGFVRAFGAKLNGREASVRTIEQAMRDAQAPNRDGDLLQFAGTIERWIAKRLRRCGGAA